MCRCGGSPQLVADLDGVDDVHLGAKGPPPGLVPPSASWIIVCLSYLDASMTILKVGTDRYIHIDRITFTEASSKNRLIVHFAIAGGDIGGPACQVRLESDEATILRRWLDASSPQ